MKTFKRAAVTVLVIYLLSIFACRRERAEVIPGGLNPAGQIEHNDKVNDVACYTNGLVGFNGLSSL